MKKLLKIAIVTILISLSFLIAEAATYRFISSTGNYFISSTGSYFVSQSTTSGSTEIERLERRRRFQ